MHAYLKFNFFSNAIKTSLCICYLFNHFAEQFSLYQIKNKMPDYFNDINGITNYTANNFMDQ